MKTKKFFHPFTKMVAHRGVSCIEVENTIPSFVCAGNKSYWGIETDVHQTLDNELVIIHDHDLKRLAGIEGKVIEEMTLKEVQEVQLLDKTGKPSPGLRIPLFTEYLDICKRYNKKCVIELKGSFKKENIVKLLDYIFEREYIKNCVFISFYWENLIALREISKDFTLQILLDKYDEETFEKIAKYHLDVDSRGDIMTLKIKRRLKKMHCKINVWTIDLVKHGILCALLGADFITSNCLE